MHEILFSYFNLYERMIFNKNAQYQNVPLDLK